jgi:flagellar biogenesis protein FliO
MRYAPRGGGPWRRAWVRGALLAVLALASASLAHAAAETPPPSPTVVPLLRMLAGVAGIGLLALGLTTWARRRRIERTGADHRIEILAMRSLGPRQRVALIEVAERRFLIGIAGDAIRPIAELCVPESFDDAMQGTWAEPAEPPPSAGPREVEGRGAAHGIGPFEGLDA